MTFPSIKQSLSVLSLAVICSSCTVTTSFTPTSGPLAQQGVTSIPAKFTWNNSGSGKVSIVMPDGEICKGRYSTVARGTISSVYGNSYGSTYSSSSYGTYNSNGSFSGTATSLENEQHGQGMVTGNRGTVLRFSYTTSARSPLHGHGSGSDNKGNRYSIVY